MTDTAAPATFPEGLVDRQRKPQRTKADHTAADRLIRAAVRRAAADLRDGSSAAAVIPILTTAGAAAALLLDD